MLLRRPVPVHLKFVVAYHKNLGKCLIFFWSKSPWQPLRFRECRGDVHREDVKVTLSPLEVSGCALLSLPQPDLWVSWQILNAFPQAYIALTPAARLMGLPANIECLSASVHCSHSHSQTHGSPDKYWMPFCKHALLSLPWPDSWVSWQILNAFLWACIALTPMARLMGLPANIECLSMSMHCSHSPARLVGLLANIECLSASMHCSHSCGQTHGSPSKYWMPFYEHALLSLSSQTHGSTGKYWMPFHRCTRGKTEQNKGICVASLTQFSDPKLIYKLLASS